MKLCLVERQDARLRCAPDLGIAQLIGQCRNAGHDATLVRASPDTLQCLLDDSVFDLFCEGYSDIVTERGGSWFKDFLRYTYDIARSNEISDKTNPDAIKDLWDLLTYMRNKVWPTWLPDYLFDSIEAACPDMVGFSLWDFYECPGVTDATTAVIKKVKDELDLPVMIGGPATVTKQSRKNIFEIFEPDLIVHHEGEHAILAAIDMCSRGKFENGDNISFRGYDGQSRPIEDLDSLAAPDFSDYPLDDFFLPMRVLPIMGSRGCPWARCAFCNHHATYKGYRELSVDRLCEIIEHYKKEYGTDMIMFHDETFTSKRARAIIDSLPKAYYYSYARAEGFDSDLLKKMYAKGFRVLVWGVESGCQKVLDSMNKGTEVKEVQQIIRDSANAGITNIAFVMFGFPGETSDCAEQTVEFLTNNADYLESHATTRFRIEDDSPIAINPKRWGLTIKEGGQYEVREGMGQKEVLDFLRKLNKMNPKTARNSFYNMPGDSEMRAYLFMQAVHGEGAGDYPIRNGIIVGDTIWPSLLKHDSDRPILRLNREQKKRYIDCDGRRKVYAKDFEQYPYVVYYTHPF